MTSVLVRPVTPTDEQRWKALYRGYRAFYRLSPDEDVVERVWCWLLDDSIEVGGLVAERAGEVVGLANHRRFHRPAAGTVGMYLDDLFVDPDRRGGGAGEALLRHLAASAAEQGCSVVRWITAEDNAVARSLYDRVATATPWVTYDLTPAGGRGAR